MNKITHRIFVGLLLTPDLLYQLEKSAEWKHYRILHGDDASAIQKIPFKRKTYFGKYLEGESIAWTALQKESEQLKKSIVLFFSKLSHDKCELVIFNQVLIS